MMKELSSYKPRKGSTPSNFFAVPDEDFSTGMVTGTKLFIEILEAMQKSGESHPCHAQLLIGEMGADLKKKGSKSRRGAATTISWLMADALLGFSKHVDFKPWLDRKLAEAEQAKEHFDIGEAKHKTEFVARMKAGKAAKAAKVAQHGQWS